MAELRGLAFTLAQLSTLQIAHSYGYFLLLLTASGVLNTLRFTICTQIGVIPTNPVSFGRRGINQPPSTATLIDPTSPLLIVADESYLEGSCDHISGIKQATAQSNRPFYSGGNFLSSGTKQFTATSIVSIPDLSPNCDLFTRL